MKVYEFKSELVAKCSDLDEVVIQVQCGAGSDYYITNFKSIVKVDNVTYIMAEDSNQLK